MTRKSMWFPGVEDAHLKKLLEERAQNTPGAPNPGFFLMRPPRPITPIWPKDPCEPAFVSQMDIAVKFFLPPNVECPSDSEKTAIQNAVRGIVNQQLGIANPDVRVKCQGTPAAFFIAIWSTTVQPGSCDDQARAGALDLFGSGPALDKLDDITAQGTFGIFVNTGVISTLAQQVFQTMPKDLDENGNPNSSGPIHLTALQPVFPTAGQGQTNSLTTLVNGYYDQLWPSVHFTTKLTDTLGVEDADCGDRKCRTDSHTDISKNVDLLPDFIVSLLTISFPVLAARLVIAAFNIPSGPGNSGGVGCGLYYRLPSDIPLPSPQPVIVDRTAAGSVGGDRPHKQKIHLCYINPRFDERGFLVSANQRLEDRTPAVQIEGPTKLSIDLNGSSAFGIYTAHSADFFADVSYAWSGGDAANYHAASTSISFSRGPHYPGETFAETVTVRVTDTEGSSVTASLKVTIQVSTKSLPPLCKEKPWMCHEQ